MIHIIYSLFLMSFSFAQLIEPKEPDCSKLDDRACLKAKANKHVVANIHNHKIFAKFLKDCKPFEMKDYLGSEAHIFKKIVGKEKEFCRVEMINPAYPMKQVCLLSSKSIQLGQKNMAEMTPEEQELNTALFSEECKQEIVGNNKEANELRTLQAKQDLKLKESIPGLRKELAVEDSKCKKGNKESCEALDMFKKTLANKCSMAVLKDLCREYSIK